MNKKHNVIVEVSDFIMWISTQHQNHDLTRLILTLLTSGIFWRNIIVKSCKFIIFMVTCSVMPPDTKQLQIEYPINLSQKLKENEKIIWRLCYQTKNKVQ